MISTVTFCGPNHGHVRFSCDSAQMNTVEHVTGSPRTSMPQGAKGMDSGAASLALARPLPPGANVQARQL